MANLASSDTILREPTAEVSPTHEKITGADSRIPITKESITRISSPSRLGIRRFYIASVDLWYEGVFFVAGAVAAILSVMGFISPLLNFQMFRGLNGAETALISVISGLLGITLTGLLAEHRLFRALREESRSIIKLNEMEEKAADLAREAIDYYSRIVTNLRSSTTNPYYREIAATELGAYRQTMILLSDAVYRAPEPNVDKMLTSVLDPSATYAAVSHRDREYWLDTRPESDEKPERKIYRDRLEAAAHKGNVMRIFIVKLEELRTKLPSYIKILKDQEGNGVRWGLAVEERLDSAIDNLWNGTIAPDLPQVRRGRFDFALINKGAVATFFTQDDDDPELRYLLAAFNIPPRDRSVRACGSAFIRLISECWIGSDTFNLEWPKFLPTVIERNLSREIGRDSTKDFVERMGRTWKEERISRIHAQRELVLRMNGDADGVIQLTRENMPGPLAVRRNRDRPLEDDMELFLKVLRADVFATGRTDHVRSLCGADIASLYETRI